MIDHTTHLLRFGSGTQLIVIGNLCGSGSDRWTSMIDRVTCPQCLERYRAEQVVHFIKGAQR